MLLVVFQAMVQAVSLILHWLGLCVGIRALPGVKTRRWRWTVGSAVIAGVWLIGVFLLAANFFRNDVLPPRIPMALATTLLFGYLLLFSPAVRRIVAAVPQRWPVGNAVLLGTISNAGAHGLVFPFVLIPVYAVPRAFLIHSYSLIGLVRKTSQQPRRAESLHYGAEAAAA